MSGWGKTATVLGGGSWGTAIAHILGTHGYHTLMWLRDQEVADEINKRRINTRYLPGQVIAEQVEATCDLARAARHAETLIVAIPSKSLRKVSYQLGNHVTGDQILISATKGLEADTLMRMSEILRQETCCRKVGALSGPNLAREVMEGHPTATVIASPFEEVVEKGERLLAGPGFRVYGNYDIVGVEIGGALKNTIAIAAGIAAGLGFGMNTNSMLITRGLAEISRFGVALGAERLTFQGLAGIGDMIATCCSPLSRNHTVGRRLAAGESLQGIQDDMLMVAEGVNTTLAVHAHVARVGVDMPICSAMYNVLFEGHEIREALRGLMTRLSRYEGSYSPIHEPATVTDSLTDAANRSTKVSQI